MKKIFVWLLLFVTVFALFGCNDNSSKDSLDSGEGSQAQQETGDGLSSETTEDSGTPTRPGTNINTSENFTFFPTEQSDLHRDALKAPYDAYIAENNPYVTSWGDYEIYSYISAESSEKYDLDLFEARYANRSYYLVKHRDTVYTISPFDMTHQNSHCITHVAITDINADGHIEILTALNSFADRGNTYYCASFITVIDTQSGNSIRMTDHQNVTYFKENRDGVISIYNADGQVPVVADLTNGKLDEKYNALATKLYETPTLNTSDYKFSKRFVEASCDLYKVEITISDGSINFPYLFQHSYDPASFEVTVKMTYLGEPFSYINGNSYLDGATVTFVNGEGEIKAEGWAADDMVTSFTVTTGQVIERTYKYNETLSPLNPVGTYDMVITYENKDNNIRESIVIKDFLELTRE